MHNNNNKDRDNEIMIITAAKCVCTVNNIQYRSQRLQYFTTHYIELSDYCTCTVLVKYSQGRQHIDVI